jgi:hypothetical protein
MLIEPEENGRCQKANNGHLIGVVFSFRFGVDHRPLKLHQKGSIGSLPMAEHHHFMASGPGKTDPNHNFLSDNLPSDSSWTGNFRCEPY